MNKATDCPYARTFIKTVDNCNTYQVYMQGGSERITYRKTIIKIRRGGE